MPPEILHPGAFYDAFTKPPWIISIPAAIPAHWLFQQGEHPARIILALSQPFKGRSRHGVNLDVPFLTMLTLANGQHPAFQIDIFPGQTVLFPLPRPSIQGGVTQ